MGMQVNVTDSEEAITIKVEGEIDLYSSPELRSAINQAVPKGRRAVRIDLGGVAYMDSSGVATLVEGLRHAGDKGVEFVLIAPSSSVMKVLQLSRLDTVFNIER